ncbi:olfactory receptor-like protein DTMT [Sphaeramia orbicularis]|uniref:Olfactory receptor n=1 Tax=Sphaeramia orbicularis TaxID=375764 RepID=A0A673BGE8_9TELE|nr:olfactory receptor-like protein DTMT [Sphaeramia orbicularis]
MASELNTTYITIDAFDNVHVYRYVYFVIIFTAYVLIICSNSTIVCLICIHKNLHEPMYIFIAALLTNSVIFSTAIHPKLLIDLLSEKPVISYSACLFQFFMFYTLGGTEFLLLAAMAYDRYVSICKPLHYTTIMTKTTISVALVLAWLLPACHMTVLVILIADMKLCDLTFKGLFCNNSVYKLHCESSQALSILGVVALTNFVLCPVIFILFTYSNILLISYRSSAEVRKKSAQTCLPHLLVLIGIVILSSYDVVIARMESDLPKTARLIMTWQIVLYHPLFNPIIYGLKMKEIHKHLKRLFCSTKIM